MKSKLLLFTLAIVILVKTPIFGQSSVHVIPAFSLTNCNGFVEVNNIFAQSPYVWKKKNSSGIYEIISNDDFIENACVGNYSLEYHLDGGQALTEYFYVPSLDSHPCSALNDGLALSDEFRQVYINETPNGIVGSFMLETVTGNLPISFNWSNGQEGPALINQPSGTYTCFIEDNLGCEKIITVTIPFFDAPTTAVSCDGMVFIDSMNLNSVAWADGSFDYLPFNTFAISDICVESLEETDLASIYFTNEFGNYNSSYLHYNSMTNCNSFDGDPLYFNTTPGNCIGMAVAVPYNNPGEITYQWSNGETTPFITDLCEGTYSCVMTDNNGCTKTVWATIGVTTPFLPYNIDTFLFEFNNNIGPGVNPSVVLDLQAIEDCSFDPNLFGSASITLIENTASGSLITWTIYAIDGAVLDSYQLEYPVTLLPGTTYSAPFILYCDGRSDGTFTISLIEFFETDLSLSLLDLSDQWIHLTNPINQELQVSFSKLFAGNLRLFDSSGKLIFSENFNGTEYTRSTSDLATGIYILELESGNQIKRMKLVK